MRCRMMSGGRRGWPVGLWAVQSQSLAWQFALQTFKPVHQREPIYSVRIARNYRALGKLDDKGMLWFWIGSHADYDRFLGQR